MKYLHIIPPSTRMLATYVSFIEDNFSAGENIHHFISIRKVPKGEKEFFEGEDRFELQGKGWQKVANLNRLIKRYDYVIWYSFIVPHRYALYLATHPSVCKKSIWVVWGLDLHNWKLNSNSLASRVKNWAHRRARKSFYAVVCLEEADRKKYLAEFGSGAIAICANLPLSKSALQELECLRFAKKRLNGKKFIQIEHNAHSFNNHLSIIEALSRHDEESFEYFIPLSYGTARDWEGNPKDYIDQVISLADKYFGDRAHPILSMMPADTYTRLLWNMDIAIFGSDRQNGLGNILRMLYVGNKVFLPRENPTYQFLTQLGCEIGDTNELSNISTEDFLRMPSDESVSIACDWIMESYYPDNLVHMWKHVFQVVEKKESVAEYEATAFSGGMVVRRPSVDGIFPQYKESIFTLKPYNWPKKNRAKCSYIYIVGSSSYAYKAINVAMHMRSALYVKGILYSGDKEPSESIKRYYVGTLNRHLPFNDDDCFIVMEEDPHMRARAIEELKRQGCNREQLIAASAMIATDVAIGEATVIGQWANVNPGSVIGNDVYIGWGVYIGVNCTIEDNCIIEDGVYIGDGSFVRAGSVVTPVDSVTA